MDQICRELDILQVSFALGLGLTLIYDILRLSRLIIPRGWLLVGIEDVVFWLLAALCVAAMCLWKNDGILRWYMIAAALAGSYICLFVEKKLKFSFYMWKKRLHSREK